jgi:hypothetical protein
MQDMNSRAVESEAPVETEVLLRDVSHRVRAGLYTDDLALKVNELLERPIDDESLEQLQIKSVASEFYDQIGDFPSAKKVVEDTAQRYLLEFQSLRKEHAFPPNMQNSMRLKARRLLKQKVWVVMHYAFAAYRHHAPDHAVDVLRVCKTVIEDVLYDREDFECLGTRARLQYCLGMAIGDTSHSDSAFEEALKLTSERLRASARNLSLPTQTAGDSEDDQIPTQQRLANYFVGRVLLSFARSRHLSGELHRSRQMLHCAAVLLSDTQHKFLKQDVQLRLGTVYRKLAGRRGVALNEAMQYLRSCHVFFGSHRHLTHFARAIYELGSAHLAFAQGLKARRSGGVPGPEYEDHIADAQRLSRELSAMPKDMATAHYLSPGLILSSRIANEIGDHKLAVEQSDEARKAAEKSGNRAAVAEALIASGEVYMKWSRFSEAARLFERAADWGRDYYVVAASATLHSAEAYMGLDRLSLAEYHFGIWERMKHRIEHQILIDLAEEVLGRMETARKSFVVPGDAGDLDYEKHRERLQDFLYERALDRHGSNIDEIARLLGVSRSTVYKWKQAHDSKTGRRFS